MRKTFLRLALLGAVAAVPAYAQTSTTAPSSTAPWAYRPDGAADQ